MTEKYIISENVKTAIIKYLSGQWQDCDSSVLTTWLESSESNRVLFENLVELWKVDMMFRREKDFDLEQAWRRLELKMQEDRSPVVRLSIVKNIIRYAAIVILAFFLGGTGHFFYQKHTDSIFAASKTVEYTVPYGSKTRLKLLDGSVVRLNAGSTLEYGRGFGFRNRDIKLSGEAYFEVAKNKKLPFIVVAKDVSVRALGTKFNVKAYPEEKNVEAILLEGSIKLQNQGAGQQQSIILLPNQKAIYKPMGTKFQVSTISNTSDVSWITDTWIIENKKLGEFAKLLERRYNVKFNFIEPSIKEFEFGGTIKDETIEQVLNAIAETSPLEYKIKNKQIILTIDETKQSEYEKILK